jgi:hypothetical protein
MQIAWSQSPSPLSQYNDDQGCSVSSTERPPEVVEMVERATDPRVREVRESVPVNEVAIFDLHQVEAAACRKGEVQPAS